MSSTCNLTPKQARFVEEYLLDGNGAQAALRAGYGPCGAKVAACRLLTRPNVKTAIDAGRHAYSERLEITRADIVAKLLEAFEMAKMMSLPLGMVRASAELARLLGLAEPEVKKIELSDGQRAVQENYLAMSDAQLLALIASGGGGGGATAH